jgi:hypothetical protein
MFLLGLCWFQLERSDAIFVVSLLLVVSAVLGAAMLSTWQLLLVLETEDTIRAVIGTSIHRISDEDLT